MKRLPTTDLYFLNACADQVAGLLRKGPVRRLGANVFATADATLLIRRDEEELMQDLLRRPGRLVYLIDDDLEAARDNPDLPPGYRARLLQFHDRHGAALAQRADCLVVTSPALQRRFAWHPDVRLLHPVWHLPMTDDRHFEDVERGGPVRAVHLGSGSHAGGLAFLQPILAELLDRHERLHFTYFGKAPALGALDRHPHVCRLRPLGWRHYRRWVGRQRFHLGLYPLSGTAFDQARSRNKLLEHGLVGAVGMYPKDWEPASIVGEGMIAAGSIPAEWRDSLSAVLTAPESLRARAAAARPTLETLNDPAPQRRFWSELLGL